MRYNKYTQQWQEEYPENVKQFKICESIHYGLAKFFGHREVEGVMSFEAAEKALEAAFWVAFESVRFDEQNDKYAVRRFFESVFAL